jgi:NAD(P)-dependent dehydrogenase (short-subunit alcohol dehydrogenase family)
MSTTDEVPSARPKTASDRAGASGKRLDGRVAIVTGAATGIGKAIAMRLAADGAAVCVNHLRTPERADAVVAAISEPGGSAIPVEADISDRGQFATIFEGTISAFGRLDILVNNAAVAPVKPLSEATEPDIDQVARRQRQGHHFRLSACDRASRRRRADHQHLQLDDRPDAAGLLHLRHDPREQSSRSLESSPRSSGHGRSRSMRSAPAQPKPRPTETESPPSSWRPLSGCRRSTASASGAALRARSRSSAP